MKRTLSFMVMALALLLTQCRKPEVKFPTPSSAEGVTVSMTVTAGPGSKTDITAAGAITWSEGDKLYVGDGEKYIGFLTLVGDGGSATGTFTGDVTLPNGTTGTLTFHFFYLGSGNSVAPAVDATSVDVLFNEQNIYKNGDKLENAKKFHIGYGSASGTVKDGVVTGINVTLVSKVALARFSFKKGGTGYSNALTLSGTHIYNKMTVNFNSSTGFSFSGTEGDIALGSGNAERYVMLVPVGTGSETLSFAGEGFEGSTTLGSGIESNKFYGRDGAIEVKPIEFSVGAGTKVKFSPGNLYWDGGAFWFEENQWSTTPASDGIWDESHVSHFKWSSFPDAVTSDYSYNDELFCASNFTVAGDSHTDWRTLSKAEWSYLIGESVPGRAKSLCGWSAVTFGESGPIVNGLIIMPDGYDFSTTPLTDGDGTTSYERWQALEASGAVFLPAAGIRDRTVVYGVGWIGLYWSSTAFSAYLSWSMSVEPESVGNSHNENRNGSPVRLVRSAS